MRFGQQGFDRLDQRIHHRAPFGLLCVDQRVKRIRL